MSLSRLFLTGSSLAFLAAAAGAQTSYVSPPYHRNHPTNDGSSLPFGADGTSVGETRTQQIHGDLQGNPRTIRGLSLRAWQRNGRREGAAQTVDMELFLGDAVPHTAVSDTYAANWVTTPTLAMARRALNLPQRTGEALSLVGPFDVQFPLDAPYVHSGAHPLGWEALCYTRTSYFTEGYRSEFAVPGRGFVGATTFAVASKGPSTCIGTFDLQIEGVLADAQGSNLCILDFLLQGGRNLYRTPCAVALGFSDPRLPFNTPSCVGTIHTDAQINLGGLFDANGQFHSNVSATWDPAWALGRFTAQGLYPTGLGGVITRGLEVRFPPGPKTQAPQMSMLQSYSSTFPRGTVSRDRGMVVRFDG